MRCFIGVELDPETAALARCVRETIVASDPGWRAEKWVPAENLHVTIAFLGEVDEEQMARLIEGLGNLSVPAFELVSPSAVAVPNARRAAMCWLEFEDERGECAQLASEVERIARDAGIEIGPGHGRFRAHVTLVRSRRGRSLRGDTRDALHECGLGLKAPSMSVPSVTVFTSTLAPTGPVYERVATVVLRGPQPIAH